MLVRNIASLCLATFLMSSEASQRSFLERVADAQPFFVGCRGVSLGRETSPTKENSLEAFRAAAISGVQAVGTDVRRTADGVLVCARDASLVRTRGVEQDVERSTVAELRRNLVPTLDEYLDLCMRYDTVPFIEIRGGDDVIAPVLDELRKRNLVKVAMLASESVEHLRMARKMEDDLFLHLVGCPEDRLDEVAALGPVGVSWNCRDASSVSPALIGRAHGLGVKCGLGACDTKEAYETMLAMGADYCFTGRLTPDGVEDKVFRLQSYLHGLSSTSATYSAEFNLGRTHGTACAPVRFAWRGASGAKYAVAVNGKGIGETSGTDCSVVADSSSIRSDPNRIEIRIVEGEDRTLSEKDRVSVYTSVPVRRGPKLSLRAFFGRLSLPIDISDEQEGVRQFARYVRENYRIEPEVRARYLRCNLGDEYRRFEDRAKRAMDYEVESVGVRYHYPNRRVSWQFNPTRNGYREWCFHLAWFDIGRDLAVYYAETGDERAAETWRDMCLSLIEDEPVPEAKAGYDTNCWRSLDVGCRLGHLMGELSVFMKSPVLTDEFLLTLFRSLWEHGRRLRTSHAHGGNWFTNEMTTLYRFTCLMPYFKETEDWRDYAQRAITRELKAQVYPDGQQHELAGGYHASVAGQFMGVLTVCRFAGVEPPNELSTTIERMFNPFMVLMRPDGRIPGLNDSPDAPVAPFLKMGSTAFPERQDMLWFATEGKNGVCPSWLSSNLPYMGAVAMRTSWGRDAVWAYMDCGPLGAGHQHEDKLNVLLSAYGHNLITEGGFYDYDTSAMRRYVLSTRSHNTVRIDGRDQDRLSRYRWRPEDIGRRADYEFSITPERDTAAAVYDGGYAGYSDRKFRHSRRLVLLKCVSGLSPLLLVVDRLEAGDDVSHAYEQIWHLNDGTVKRLERGCFAARYPGGVGLSGFSSDGAASFVDKCGQREPELQGWNPGSWSRNNASPIATPVLCGTFRKSRRVVTILHPLVKGIASPVRTVIASEDVADKSVSIVLANGEVVHVEE